jgi:hypothetical protein
MGEWGLVISGEPFCFLVSHLSLNKVNNIRILRNTVKGNLKRNGKSLIIMLL